jgi:hypothetical protein
MTVEALVSPYAVPFVAVFRGIWRARQDLNPVEVYELARRDGFSNRKIRMKSATFVARRLAIARRI